MSDHNWIHVTINQKNNSWPVKVIYYRKLKNIDDDEIENNIASSPLIVETADNIHALVEHHDTLPAYSINTLHSSPRLSGCPWFNEDIKQAKNERRRRERKWRSTRLATDLIHLKKQRHRVCQMLDSAKVTFYLSTMTRSQRVVKIVNLYSGSWIILLDVDTSHTCLIWI